MAKSPGNIARVADLVAAGVSPRALRYALISVHYRAPLNYSDESLAAAGAAVERIDALLAALAAYREDRADDPALPAVLDADAGRVRGRPRRRPQHVRRAGRRVRRGPRAQPPARRPDAVDGRRRHGRRRSSGSWTRCSGSPRPADAALEPALAALLDARVAARAATDWAASDRLRDELLARGIAVEDTRDGQRWRHVVAAGG